MHSGIIRTQEKQDFEFVWRLNVRCAEGLKVCGVLRPGSKWWLTLKYQAVSVHTFLCVGTLCFTAVYASSNSPGLTRSTSKWMTLERTAAGVTHHYHALHSHNYHPQPHVQVAALLINLTRNIPFQTQPPVGAATLPNVQTYSKSNGGSGCDGSTVDPV